MIRHLLSALSIAAILGVFALTLRTAGAQEQVRRLDVALARVCVAEAGWNVAQTGECAAIYDVIETRAKARDVSPGRALFDYSRNHFDASRSARPWVAGLDERAEQPAHWPTRIDWTRYRPRWLLTLEHAAKVLRGEVPSPCIGRVGVWGGEMDDWRAERAGLERVECGPGVRNHFWRVPRRGAS